MIARRCTYSPNASGGPPPVIDTYYDSVVSDTSGLLYYWKMGEALSSDPAADSADSNPGTYADGLTMSHPGIPGSSTTTVDFTGPHGFFYTGVEISNPLAFSEEAWVQTTETVGEGVLGFGSPETGDWPTCDRTLYIGTDGKPYFGIYAGGVVTINGPTAVNDGEWHHLVAVLAANNNMLLYVDGALVASNSNTAPPANFSGWWRGGYGPPPGWPSGGSYQEFNGMMAHVAIYDTPLSGATVAAHYAAGRGSRFVKDSFTDVDGTSLLSHVGEIGATWTPTSGDDGTMVITSNKLHEGGANTTDNYASGTPSSPDYQLTADFITVGTGGDGYGPGLWARWTPSAGTPSGYLLVYTAGEYRVYRATTGSFTIILTYTSPPMAETTLSCVGSTISLLIAGAVVASVTDAVISIAGKVGIRFSTSHDDSTDGIWLDNFEAVDSPFSDASNLNTYTLNGTMAYDATDDQLVSTGVSHSAGSAIWPTIIHTLDGRSLQFDTDNVVGQADGWSAMMLDAAQEDIHSFSEGFFHGFETNAAAGAGAETFSGNPPYIIVNSSVTHGVNQAIPTGGADGPVTDASLAGLHTWKIDFAIDPSISGNYLITVSMDGAVVIPAVSTPVAGSPSTGWLLGFGSSDGADTGTYNFKNVVLT